MLQMGRLLTMHAQNATVIACVIRVVITENFLFFEHHLGWTTRYGNIQCCRRCSGSSIR